MEKILQEKQARLDEILRVNAGLLVAYSGGVDSAYLAWRAHEMLGDQMLAVIADSPSLSRRHLHEAKLFAQRHNIPLEIIATAELENPAYAKNDSQRCFHCKSELFAVMQAAQSRLGLRHLAYGMNLDDKGDFRPGQKAAQQHGVLAPLVDAGLTKEDIRALAQAAGLEVWDKPAAPCLSSRVAYGLAVTPTVLGRVEAGEDYLWSLGLRHFRVRYHGEIARIEIAREEMAGILSVEKLEAISAHLKSLGFQHVALDCGGLQSGSLNRSLSPETLQA